MSEAIHAKPVAVAAPTFSQPGAAMVDLRSDSSPLNKVRPPSLPARQCTSGSTTGVTCSASPATEPAMTSARDFVVRGLLAGLIAGLVAFGVAYVVGEPSVNVAIAFEESGGSGHHYEAEPTTNDGTAAAEVPRSLRSTAGLLTATMVGGVTLGGLVGVIGALALGQQRQLAAQSTIRRE
jgi:hypothetical protein